VLFSLNQNGQAGSVSHPAHRDTFTIVSQESQWERFSIATENGGIAVENRFHNKQRRCLLMGFVTSIISRLLKKSDLTPPLY
jgi:hypothetical protein